MRSRYSAFCVGRADYLVETLHPSRRGPELFRELEETVSTMRWVGLRVLATEAGQALDEEGWVEFVADGQGPKGATRLHERSRFVKEGGRWFYVDGEFDNLRSIPNPGRNDPCWCGNGRKFKKCHGSPKAAGG